MVNTVIGKKKRNVLRLLKYAVRLCTKSAGAYRGFVIFKDAKGVNVLKSRMIKDRYVEECKTIRY